MESDTHQVDGDSRSSRKAINAMDEAIKLLEEWLSLTSSRTTFTSQEIADLLLDFRQALTRTEIPVPEPV